MAPLAPRNPGGGAVLDGHAGAVTVLSNSPAAFASGNEGGESVTAPAVRPVKNKERQQSGMGAVHPVIRWIWEQKRAGADGYFGSGG